MIHHNNPKFLFIHIPKAGGSSITKTLANYLNVDRNTLRPQQYKFIYARNIVDILGNNYKDYYIFSIVRNPWARIVSYFHYLRQIKKPPGNISSNVQFKDWLYNSNLDGVRPAINQLSQNSIDVCDKINFIGKTETISIDWVNIRKSLGLNNDLQLIHDKQTQHDYYTLYYDNQARDFVAKKYERDIKLFEYEFK